MSTSVNIATSGARFLCWRCRGDENTGAPDLADGWFSVTWSVATWEGPELSSVELSGFELWTSDSSISILSSSASTGSSEGFSGRDGFDLVETRSGDSNKDDSDKADGGEVGAKKD